MTQPALLRWPVRLRSFRIDPDLAGRPISLGTKASYRLSLDLPKDVDDSILGVTEWRPEAAAQVTEARAGRATIVTVRQAVLRANFKTDLDYLANLGTQTATDAQWKAVQKLRTEATAVAEGRLRDFIDAHAVRQRVFGLGIDEPPIVTLSVLDVGRPPNRINFGHPPQSIVITSGSHGLTLDEARKIRSNLQRGRSVPLGWLQYLEAHRRLLSEDARPALVEAVTAIEVGLKESLRRRSPRSKAVASLLNTDRLRDLMKDIAEKVLGQSYVTADKTNYDKIDALIKQRHALVHGGHPPDRDVLTPQLEAVRKLLEWLDSKAPWE